jgi:hypothetical protein
LDPPESFANGRNYADTQRKRYQRKHSKNHQSGSVAEFSLLWSLVKHFQVSDEAKGFRSKAEASANAG